MGEEPLLPVTPPPWNAYGVTTGKVILFAANVLLFIVALALFRFWSRSWLVALPLAIVFSTIYIAAGAYCISWSERLRDWGFPVEIRAWSTEAKLQCGAIWPIVLTFWLVVAVFNRVVTNLYREDRS